MTYLLALLLLCPQENGQERKTGKAAQINGEVITWDDIYVKFKGFKPKDITEELLRAELRQQAEEKLFLQEAKKREITVTEREIDEAVERVIRAFGGKDKFEQFLRWKKMTPTEHRDLRAKELLEVKLYRYLVASAWKGDAMLLVEMVTPDEIRDYYNSHKDQFKAIQHLTVLRLGLQFRSDEEKKVKKRIAESLRRKVLEGTDLYMLAQYYSDVRITTEGRAEYVMKEVKRDNTFFAAETTRYLFEKLPVQTISDVIEDGTSFNLFYIIDRVNKPEDSFEDAQIKIRSELEHTKRDENRRRLLEQLVKKAYIDPPDLFK